MCSNPYKCEILHCISIPLLGLVSLGDSLLPDTPVDFVYLVEVL